MPNKPLSTVPASPAKYCVLLLLPEGMTPSVMYMTGTIRSWIHYCQLRCTEDTQYEDQLIANQIGDILGEQLPAIKDIQL